MLIAKIIALAVIWLLSLFFGQIYCVWRTACRRIARDYRDWSILCKHIEEGLEIPLIHHLKHPDNLLDSERSIFLPEWTNWYCKLAWFFLVLLGVFALVFFPWYVALAVLVGQIILQPIVAMVSMNRDDSYYLWSRTLYRKASKTLARP